MRLLLQPVRVATGHDEEGLLVFAEGRLVAVLVRLTEEHDDLAGLWFLEVGFGPLGEQTYPTFADLEAAQNWIGQRLGQRVIWRVSRRRSGSMLPAHLSSGAGNWGRSWRPA